jgi:4-hydroxy-2-oxoglutarate aldolase
MLKLQGIFPPITTPFNHEGDLYEAKVRHNIEKYNRTGLSGYVVGGSTGESVLLTTEEKRRLWQLVAEHADEKKLLIAGTGVESVRD